MRNVHHGDQSNKKHERATAKPSTQQVDEEIPDPTRNMDGQTTRGNRLNHLWYRIQAYGMEQTDGNRKSLSQRMAHKYEAQPLLWRNKRMMHVLQHKRGLETRHIVQGTRRGSKQGRLVGTG
jgi:hypothetical protein